MAGVRARSSRMAARGQSRPHPRLWIGRQRLWFSGRAPRALDVLYAHPRGGDWTRKKPSVAWRSWLLAAGGLFTAITWSGLPRRMRRPIFAAYAVAYFPDLAENGLRAWRSPAAVRGRAYGRCWAWGARCCFGLIGLKSFFSGQDHQQSPGSVIPATAGVLRGRGRSTIHRRSGRALGAAAITAPCALHPFALLDSRLLVWRSIGRGFLPATACSTGWAPLGGQQRGTSTGNSCSPPWAWIDHPPERRLTRTGEAVSRRRCVEKWTRRRSFGISLIPWPRPSRLRPSDRITASMAFHSLRRVLLRGHWCSSGGCAS